MGTRLSKVAVFGTALLASTVAIAQPRPPAPPQQVPQAGPGPLPAADFARQGTDRYNAGDYAGAIDMLRRAHELEPNNFEYRFMLAQALRESGNCTEATIHYKALTTTAPPDRLNDVNSGITACTPVTIAPQPEMPPPPAPPPPAETVVARGGVRPAEGALLVGAGVGLGAGLALFLAARSDDSDADAAASYEDHARISNRAGRLRVASALFAGAGVALGAIAVIRIRASKEGTELAIKPKQGGGVLVLERSW